MKNIDEVVDFGEELDVENIIGKVSSIVNGTMDGMKDVVIDEIPCPDSEKNEERNIGDTVPDIVPVDIFEEWKDGKTTYMLKKNGETVCRIVGLYENSARRRYPMWRYRPGRTKPEDVYMYMLFHGFNLEIEGNVRTDGNRKPVTGNLKVDVVIAGGDGKDWSTEYEFGLFFDPDGRKSTRQRYFPRWEYERLTGKRNDVGMTCDRRGEYNEHTRYVKKLTGIEPDDSGICVPIRIPYTGFTVGEFADMIGRISDHWMKYRGTDIHLNIDRKGICPGERRILLDIGMIHDLEIVRNEVLSWRR